MCGNSVNYLLSEPSERRYKRELVARFDAEEITTLHILLRDSLRSNRSSQCLRHHVQSLDFLTASLAIATFKVKGLGFPSLSGRGREGLSHRGLDPRSPANINTEVQRHRENN